MHPKNTKDWKIYPLQTPEKNSARQCYSGIDDVRNWVLSRVLKTQAVALQEQPAIHFVAGDTWSYRDCLKQGTWTAHCLSTVGVRKGDKVVVMVNDPAHFCRLWFGLSLIGAVMVAIHSELKGRILQHQLACQPVVIAGDRTTLPAIAKACGPASRSTKILSTDNGLTPGLHSLVDHYLDDIKPLGGREYGDTAFSDLACVMYTSGTSGPSKGVLMPEAHCFMFAMGTIENQLLKSQDTFYICLPLFHANGLFMQLYACLVAGAKAVVRRRFSARHWLNDIRHYQATHTNLLGATVAFVTAQPATDQDQDHCLRVVGAAPLPEASEKALRYRFEIADVLPLYGMTEVNIPLYGQMGESAPGTCGKVYHRWFEVEIRDPRTDLPVNTGEVGEIMVRPRHPYCFMSGYAGLPGKTLDVWRNFWFHTGDAGKQRDDGYVVFVDRIKDSIRRRGENISSYEVEQSLQDIDGIVEIAAYGVPAGAEGMEEDVMIAIIVNPNHPIDPGKVYEVAKHRLPRFALPRYIRLIDALPKTPTGKVQKVKLKEMGITGHCWDALRQIP